MSLERNPPTQTILPIPPKQTRSTQDLEIQHFFLNSSQSLICIPFSLETFYALMMRCDDYFSFVWNVGLGDGAAEERLGGFEGDAEVLGEGCEG